MAGFLGSEKLPATYQETFHIKDDVTRMTYNALGNTGMDVSVLSYGASALGSMYRKTDDEESVEVVKNVIKSGVNYIDTAPWYGHGKSETVLGKAFKEIPRETYYLTTKVGRYFPEVDRMFDFRAERTLQSVEESLQRLGLDYVDVIQVHDMEFAPNLDIIINETLPALQKVKDAGKAKFIGITGYPLDNFKAVLERSTVKIDTILTYCRACMNDNSLLDYLPYFKDKGVGVVNASPIGMGLLSNRGPPVWHPADADIKKACSDAAAYCQAKNVDISRLALRFTLDQPVPTTLVSTASNDNIRKNLDSVFTPLSDLETQVMADVTQKFFKPLKNKNWEGEEVRHYWAKIKGSEKTENLTLG